MPPSQPLPRTEEKNLNAYAGVEVLKGAARNGMGGLEMKKSEAEIKREKCRPGTRLSIKIGQPAFALILLILNRPHLLSHQCQHYHHCIFMSLDIGLG